MTGPCRIGPFLSSVVPSVAVALGKGYPKEQGGLGRAFWSPIRRNPASHTRNLDVLFCSSSAFRLNIFDSPLTTSIQNRLILQNGHHQSHPADFFTRGHSDPSDKMNASLPPGAAISDPGSHPAVLWIVAKQHHESIFHPSYLPPPALWLPHKGLLEGIWNVRRV
jgi:hypothetical protein